MIEFIKSALGFGEQELNDKLAASLPARAEEEIRNGSNLKRMESIREKYKDRAQQIRNR